jgi:hypothetical protein
MKKVLYAFAASAMLAGCSLDELQSQDNSSFAKIDKVNVVVDPFKAEEGASTRTLLSYSNSQMIFSWSQNDEIGVFPIEPTVGTQVQQTLDLGESEDGGLNASFNGGAWLLKENNTYCAYYPFCGDMKLNESYTEIPMDMEGQVQTANANSTHLGAFDFMYSLPTKVENAQVDLHFSHIPGILVLDLTMPEAATLTKLVLTAQNPIFVTKAKMNAKEGTFVATETSTSISLGLGRFNSSANQVMRFFISVLPTTNGESLKEPVDANVISTTGLCYAGSLNDGLRIKKGYVYSRSATLVRAADEYDDKDYVDLGTGDGTLWGRNNVDVYDEVTTPEFYAWFDIAPKDDYSWDNYETYMEDEQDCSYCSPNSDSQSVLNPGTDDVAYLMMDPENHWYIPTSEQWQNLVEKCTWTWTTMSGKSGYMVSHKEKPARWIFLPVNGLMVGTSKTETSAGYYWASNLDTKSTNWLKGYCLKINESAFGVTSIDRCYGASVRPIYVP